MLMARLRQELLHAADILCAPFCGGRLFDTLLRHLRELRNTITAYDLRLALYDVYTHKDILLAKSRGRC